MINFLLNKSKLILVFLLLIISIGVILPLFKSGFPITDDGTWMIIRLSSFYQNLREGQFPVRFLGRLNHGYGYPVANFLYPGFLYLGSIFKILSLTFVQSIKSVMILSITGSTISVFLWLKHKFGSIASFAGSLIFITSPYILFDLYSRGSVGELLAIFTMTLFLAAYSYGLKLLPTIFLGLLVISHNSLAVMFIFPLAIYAIISRNWRLIKIICGAILISIFFWAPALIEKSLVRFDDLMVSKPNEYFTTWNKFMLIPFSMLIYFIFSIFKIKNEKNEPNLKNILMTFIISLVLVSPLSSLLWNIKIFNQLFQFPFRFYTITIITGAWITAYAIDRIPFRLKFFCVFVIFGLNLIQIVPYFQNIKYQIFPEEYYSTNEASTTVADEYLPKYVQKLEEEHSIQKVVIIDGSGEIKQKLVNSQVVNAELYLHEPSTIQINTIYYPGWGITVDNLLFRINYDNPYGLIRITVPAGKHDLHGEFRETPFRFACDLISLFSLFGITISYLITNHKRKEIHD